MVELVSGYGVYITQKQLGEVIDESIGSPMQNLMNRYFTPLILSKSSCLGKKEYCNPALDKGIISACLSK